MTTLSNSTLYRSLLLIVGVGVLFAFALTANAQSFDDPVELTGYAWSSNIGWISMNCSNIAGSCGEADYKVQINPDFTITGYAWSSNIGWIEFGSFSGSLPPLDADSDATAKIDPDTNEITGWARALSHGDGWDGWISLSCENTNDCANSNYGVSAGENDFSGYAWGDDVVGWTTFNNVSFTAPCSPTSRCTADGSAQEDVDQWCRVTTTDCGFGYECPYPSGFQCIIVEPVGTLEADPRIIPAGGTTTFTWDIDPATSANCKIEVGSQTIFTAGGDSFVHEGSAESSPLSAETEAELICPDASGTDYVVDSVTITITGTVQEI